MKKSLTIVALVIILFLNLSTAIAQNKQLDKVIAVIGNSETITLLEFEKRKYFFTKNLTLTNQEELNLLNKEILEKIVLEKITSIIGKERNITIPDDEKLLSSIQDENIKVEIKTNKMFLSDYISEIKQQFIISRLINSDEELKEYLSRDINEDEINELADSLYEKNKQNLRTVKVSFIIITVTLPNNLTLKEEKEIENVFLKISNLIESQKYTQAIQLAKKELSKYLVKEATRFVEKPITVQQLAKEGMPIELINPIAGLKPMQVLPYPIKGLKIKGKDYAFGLKVLSREETTLTKEEFKITISLEPNFKKQVSEKIYSDRIKKWLLNTFKKYQYNINFLDKSYEIKLYWNYYSHNQ